MRKEEIQTLLILQTMKNRVFIWPEVLLSIIRIMVESSGQADFKGRIDGGCMVDAGFLLDVCLVGEWGVFRK